MFEVSLNGWTPGLEKVKLNRLLREKPGMSLSEAKTKVDQLLEGHEVILSLATRQDAREFAERAQELGAMCVLDEKVGSSR